MTKHCFTTQSDLYHHILRQTQRPHATCSPMVTRPVALSLLQRMRKTV